MAHHNRKNITIPLQGVDSGFSQISNANLVKARLLEATIVTKILRAPNGNRRVFQKLPFHSRRRSMSHNIHLIPKRYRAAASKEKERSDGAVRKKKMNRKWRRRPRNLASEYLRRQKNGRWLETHIWHAKRMFMGLRWGYKLALRPTNKIHRLSFRQTSHGCTIYDASYYALFELRGSYDEIISLLRPMGPKKFCAFAAKSYTDGSRRGKCNLYYPNEYPARLICPVDFLWCPDTVNETTKRLWIFVHPAAKLELQEVLNLGIVDYPGLTFEDRVNHVCRFELRGPRSTPIIANAVQHIVNLEDPAIQKMWSYVSKTYNTGSLPDGLVVGCLVRDPRIAMRIANKHRKIAMPDQPRKIGRAAPMEHIQSLLINQIPPGLSSSKLWDTALVKQLQSSRDSVEKIATKKAKNTFSIRYAPVQDERLLPIIMIQNKGGLQRGFGSGWDVLVPSNYAHAFWKAFSFSGTLAIGLNQRHTQHFEQGIPIFPDDYPDTFGYVSTESILSQERESTALKRPPSKRMNAKKIGIRSPYRNDWSQVIPPVESEIMAGNPDGTNAEMSGLVDERDEVMNKRKITVLRDEQLAAFCKFIGVYSYSSSTLRMASNIELASSTVDRGLIPVHIRMIRKGVPKYNCHLYLPTEADFDELRKNRKWSGRLLPNNWKQDTNQFPGRLIGFVTSGDYSLIRAGGYALGFCSALGMKDLTDLQNKKRHAGSLILMARNPFSRQYRPAFVSIVGSDHY